MAKLKKRYVAFNEGYIEALRQFTRDSEDPDDLRGRGYFFDTGVRGLRLRVGVRKLSWSFFRQYSEKGRKLTKFRHLGEWPEVKVQEARQAALAVAAERRRPGRKITFAEAFDSYLEFLKRKAEAKGKAPLWAHNVEKIGKQLLLPKFGNWTLAELSADPRAIRDWHATISKGRPTHGNHAAKILRAVYRREAKAERSLPPELPTSAVEFAEVKPSKNALAFADFPKWAAAWRKIDNPVHRGYFLFCLLTGCRPGEGARIRWADIDVKRRVVTISAPKLGAPIEIPLSAPIVRALKMARRQSADGELVFPGCSSPKDVLPTTGVALRRTYRSVAADLKVDEVLTSLLMGHSLRGSINRGYISRLVMGGGMSLREVQRKISKRIVALLGIEM